MHVYIISNYLFMMSYIKLFKLPQPIYHTHTNNSKLFNNLPQEFVQVCFFHQELQQQVAPNLPENEKV